MVETGRIQVASARGRARVTIEVSTQLSTPTYFPAISATSTTARPSPLAQLIFESGFPRVLVSAYDVAVKTAPQSRRMLMDGAKKYQGKKNVILLDSGVFESYWFQDGKWNFAKYASVVKKVSPAFFISFDGGVHTHGKRGEDGFVLRDVDRSISLSPKAICLVAVHGTTPERLVKNVQTLLDKRPHVVAIAVAERDCGETIIQRSHTIALVRNALGERFLHILGCGHPQSMAAYVYVGADSFDSLDWCRHGIRRSTNDLVDLSHVSIQGCSCNVCGQGVARTEAALLHNLLYYQDFSAQLQRMTKEGTLRDFIMAHLGKTAIETIDGRIPK